MKAVFADTGFWVALLNPKDNLHLKARDVVSGLGSVDVVTSQMVLAELLNDFAGRGTMLRKAAVDLVEQLSKNPRTTVVSQSSEQFNAGLGLYAGREDKDWGVTDCVSFLIMQAHSISHALTHDRHFEQMGFVALLR